MDDYCTVPARPPIYPLNTVQEAHMCKSSFELLYRPKKLLYQKYFREIVDFFHINRRYFSKEIQTKIIKYFVSEL